MRHATTRDATSTSGATPTIAYRGRPHHLRRHRASNWAWDPESEAVLLASLLQPPARSELRQPGGPRRDVERDALLARTRRRRVPGGRRAVPHRAGGDDLREPARDARGAQVPAQPARRALPRSHAARRGQPVARGRARVLRRRRRVPHGVSLPADAAHVHGHAARGPQAAHRDHRTHARHPRELPVGDLPAQPRRADAGDGHRRRARLHVSTSTPRDPRIAHQPRHPAAAGAAARWRSPARSS